MFKREILKSPASLLRIQAWGACLLWLAICSPASAQQARFAGRWLDEGTDLRNAFRDVVSDARQATVRVLLDEETVALGTIVGSDGWIVTKGSEITGSVRCRLQDGRELAAAAAGYDRDTDVTLLKVQATDLPAIRWRNTEDPAVGEWLATVGPDARPIAVGIVSVARRAIVVERISGVLGVRLERGNGAARIEEVVAESAAEQAELQAGDVILRVAEKAIDTSESLKRTIREYEPGTTLDIAVRRGDTDLVLSATLSHPFGDFLRGIAAQNEMGGKLSGRRTGFPAVLQHDTVLSPSDCGGPIVDLNGDAVGINIARSGRTESFALPSDVVVSLLEKLRSAATPAELLATDAAPDSPDDANPTSLEAGGQ